MDSKDWTVYNGLIGVVKYDPMAQHIYFNETALHLLDLPTGTNLAQFVEVISTPLWHQLSQLKNGQSKLIAWPVAAQQPSHWLLWTAAHTNTVTPQLFFQVTDQTELGRASRHWQQQAQLASIGQAMAGICHEVNQPLNAMRMRIYGLQAMHQGAGIDHIDEHLAALDKQVGRCAETLSNMRAMVGHQSLNLSRFDAGKSVERIVQLLQHQLELQQVHLCVTDSCNNINAEFLVFGQAQQLEQVLINLINNARDALVEQPTMDGPATISLSLSLQANNGIEGVAINVSDNGPGIATELQEKVFEAYYTSKSTQQGTGLGLAICRDLMHDLGGQLTLSSGLGKTTFSLWMPTTVNEVTLVLQ
jgi:C4-dicarboxylate-specific signal transduction histidine kinase